MTATVIGDFPAALSDIPLADWTAAIDDRHSVRTYDGASLEQSMLQSLETRSRSLCRPGVARVVLVPQVPSKVFTGIIGSYGKVTGASSAFLMIGNENEAAFQESAGYLGEAMVLAATSLGLGTCWIAGFFDRRCASSLVPLADGERVLAISPLGYAHERTRSSERMIKRLAGSHARKPMEAIARDLDAELWPEWARNGLRLARTAPSAVNRQPWRFALEPDRGAVIVSAVEEGRDGGISRRLDCGIAMLHFEVGARSSGADGRWESLEPPGVARYLVGATNTQPGSL